MQGLCSQGRHKLQEAACGLTTSIYEPPCQTGVFAVVDATLSQPAIVLAELGRHAVLVGLRLGAVRVAGGDGLRRALPINAEQPAVASILITGGWASGRRGGGRVARTIVNNLPNAGLLLLIEVVL